MTGPMNGTAPSSSASPLEELSAMLRASADVVERGEFHPVLMQTILHLNVYTSEYAEGMAASASSNNETSATTGGEVPSSVESGAFRDVPDSAYRSAPNNTSTSATAAVATGGYKSKMSSPFILKGMKKTLEKVTAFDKPKFVGEKNGVREEIPFDESRKASTININSNNNDVIDGDNIASTTSTQQQRQHQRTANNNDLPSNNAVTDPSKPARPCFQRPINPSSNLIANGWIDQQRRSKMRVVWKDVLASLVEGRRPGEETTLWIQRQVIDYATMKVTGLEALHQIPMKWLEEVNYVDLYGDHQFTLKVYNIAEEFFFRTRDEQSAQSWVLTLRSARDASLEGNVRMAGASEATEKRPTAKDMGLHDLEDWDTNDRQQGQGGETTMGDVGGGISPPQASSDSRPSDINQQQQQQQRNQAPARLSIAELRAIAHGVGYNTRGMERQDLERIAAYVLNNGRQNPTPTTNAATTTAPTASAGVDGTHQRMQQEAVMREAEQRAMAEMRERELAQKSQEEARRQKEIEEQAALERMRREREESEKRRVEELVEQQRRQRQDLDAQIADNKRRQEEERHRKMAELQAQQQSQAATERIKREEEERRRVQQQQQQQRPSSNPTPPTSNGYPQNQQQWQQQQQQQQWQQQQQHPGQQQRPNSNPSPPTAGGHPPNQQQWQQQQQQQQWQKQHHQQPPRPPSGDTGGNNAREMPGVPSKYAKQMDGKSDGDQVISASTLQIKRAILINWALQPPSLNALRPIDQLITTIHSAMPPAYGVGPHEYFTRFTPITKRELIASPVMGNHPDETKLKKAVRKVKVFLHPDKLPRDFTSDQAFVARMLWDITSDSWEEFQKHKDELDWIRG